MRYVATLFVALFALAACSTVEPAPKKAEATPRQALESAVKDCTADKDCLASLKADEHLLGSCAWYKAVGCGAAVAAAAAACVITEGEACLEAVAAVAAIGCCDCLPSGVVRDMCKSVGADGKAVAPKAADVKADVKVEPPAKQVDAGPTPKAADAK
jgi:hypothetical protein